jgi:type IV secretory pathway protease TraF
MNQSLVLLALLAVTGAHAAPRPGGVATFDQGMQAILGEYLSVQDALASDSLEGVAPAARKLAAAAQRLNVKAAGPHAKDFAALPKDLVASASALAAAKDLAAARQVFKELSRPMVQWASLTKPTHVQVVYCSMAEGKWLQTSPGVRNPYYGASMLRCGEVVASAHPAPSHGHHTY